MNVQVMLAMLEKMFGHLPGSKERLEWFRSRAHQANTTAAVPNPPPGDPEIPVGG